MRGGSKRIRKDFYENYPIKIDSMSEDINKLLKKVEEKHRDDVEALTRRIENIESALEEFFSRVEKIEKMEKLSQLEEKISDMEDLSMLTRIELIKINEYLKKTHFGSFSPTLEPRMDQLEARIKNLEENISAPREDISEVKKTVEELKASQEKLKSSVAKLSRLLKKVVELK